jgi:hypothetical protein
MDEFVGLNEGGLDGFAQHRNQARAGAVASAAALWGDLISGKAPSYFLQEALAPRTPAVARAIAANYPGVFRENLTTSDFPYLTGDVLDRMLLARYREFPAAWRQFVSVRTVRDFRTVRRIAVDGAEGQLSQQNESEELEYVGLSETSYTYAAKKFSKGVKISFEALMNDDLGAFEDVPNRLGRGAARTLAKFVTDLYVGTTGPDGTFFASGNANIVTSNPVLSLAALNTAWGILRSMKDSDSEPIMVESVILVVPPALEVTARNIVNATTVRQTTAGGASGLELETQNWLGSSLSVVVDPYIPIIASSSNGSTSWFLFASPSVGRPAIEVGQLAGFQEPALYQKMANTVRIGGGMDQMAGDFSTMSQEYKAVIGFGGTLLSPKSAVASNGSGS